MNQLSDHSSGGISDLMIEIGAKYQESDHVLVDQLISDLKERGFGILFIMFCAIPSLPIPAQGIATILAVPVLLLALQLIMGKHTIWLPAFIRNKSVSSRKIVKVSQIALPLLRKFERLSRPRLGFMTKPATERMIGLFVLLCSISMALPIPFSNTVPSIGIVVMSLGMMEKDGLAILGGMIIGIAGMLITTTILLVGTEVFMTFVEMIQGQFSVF